MYFGKKMGHIHCVCPSKPVILTWIGSSSSPQTFRWSFIPSGRSLLSEICLTLKWEMLQHKYNINKNVVFNWYRPHNAVHTDHSFSGCGKYFFFFLADQKKCDHNFLYQTRTNFTIPRRGTSISDTSQNRRERLPSTSGYTSASGDERGR